MFYCDKNVFIQNKFQKAITLGYFIISSIIGFASYLMYSIQLVLYRPAYFTR
jgi:uncharacterized protein with PQ loop repeat